MIIFFLINQILFIVQNVASSILNEWLEDNNKKLIQLLSYMLEIYVTHFIVLCCKWAELHSFFKFFWMKYEFDQVIWKIVSI